MLTLKDQHFDGQFLKSFQNDVVIIAYVAEWCHFCQKLKSEYKQLSKILLNKAIVAVVDADESNKMIEKNNKFLYGYKVQYFPTIVIYKNGYFIKEFSGERTANKMASEVFKYL